MPKVMAAANARETRRLVGHHARKQAGIVHVLSAAPTEAHDNDVHRGLTHDHATVAAKFQCMG